MACQDVGSANPDIAGLGIVVSFAFQAGLSLILSLWSLSLWGSAHTSLARDIQPFLFVYPLTSTYYDFSFKALLKQIVSVASPNRRSDGNATSPSSLAKSVRSACKKKSIDNVLATISDLQIMNALAILLAASIQYKSITLYHLHIVYDTASFTGISVCASLVNASASKDLMKHTRLFPLAVFAIAYVSFSVIFAIRLKSWDEAVPGHCYNTQFMASSSTAHPLGDYIYLGITWLYSMTALMGCYKVSSSLFSPPVAHASSSLSQMDLLPTIVSSNLTPSRPLSQRMAKNRFWARFAQFMESKGLDINLEVFAATSALNLYEKPETFVWVVVPMAMAQYPLHLCMVIAIRVGNESLLNGDSENTWGFGQIVSLILCAAALLECVKGIVEYRENIQLQRSLGEAETFQDGQDQAIGAIRRRRNSY